MRETRAAGRVAQHEPLSEQTPGAACGQHSPVACNPLT